MLFERGGNCQFKQFSQKSKLALLLLKSNKALLYFHQSLDSLYFMTHVLFYTTAIYLSMWRNFWAEKVLGSSLGLCVTWGHAEVAFFSRAGKKNQL